MSSTGTVSDLVYKKDNTSTLIYTSNNVVYTVEVDKEGKVNIVSKVITENQELTGVLADIVTEENYGDTVEYEAGKVEDWRIFYNDGENVFLISTDIIDNNLVDTEKTGLFIYGGKAVYWNNVASIPYEGMTDVNGDIASKYMFGWLNSYPNSETTGAKATAALFDVAAWANFVDTKYAESAIGGPTAEMFIASWNERAKLIGYVELSYSYEDYGYEILNIPYDEYGSHLPSNDGIDNSLYYKISAEDFGGGSYFLASPSNAYKNETSITEDGTGLVRCGYTGQIGGSEVNYILSGIRPVVCLKADIIGEYDYDNEIWKLSIGK